MSESSQPESNKEVQSPCISVCAMDDATGFCHGCYRTLEEIQGWWDLDNSEKQTIVEAASHREKVVFG